MSEPISTPRPRGGPGALFGRADQLDAITRALGDAESGQLAALALDGVPGMGKSALLAEAIELTQARGHRVARAEGHPLEQDYAFGIVRQLFEPIIAGYPDDVRAELLSGVVAPAATVLWPTVGAMTHAGDGTFAVLHGLYWLVLRLAERSPLTLIVDDVQWADAASLRWLTYLSRRAEDLPVLVLLARTTGVRGGQDTLVEELVGGLDAVRVGGLNREDIAELCLAEFGVEAEPPFVLGCLAVTGGNPFLLRELTRTLADKGIAPVGGSVRELAEFSPHTVARWVRGRVRRAMPDATQDCVAVARAVAILDEHAELATVAALTELDLDRAAQAADTLTRMGLLHSDTRLRFVHSIVRNAVDGEIAVASRRAAHTAAARVLADRRASPEEISAHLLECDRVGEPWAVDALRMAGRLALRRGVADSAVRYLDRTLAERPEPSVRLDVLAELGRAELGVNARTAVTHLKEAFDGVLREPGDPATSAQFLAQVATDLTIASASSGGWQQAVEVLDRAVLSVSADRELAFTLEGHGVAAGYGIPGFPYEQRLARLRSLAGDDPRNHTVVSGLTSHYLSSLGRSRDEAVAHARGLSTLTAPYSAMDLFVLYLGGLTLCRADDFEGAARYAEILMVQAPLRGRPIFAEAGHGLRAIAAFHTGQLTDTIDELRAAIKLRDELLGGVRRPSGLEGFLIRTHLAQGDHDAADQVLASVGTPDTWTRTYLANWLLHGRGTLRARRGDVEGALADHLACGQSLAEVPVHNPAEIPWRSRAALMHRRLGNTDEALRLIEEELALAREWGAPRAIAFALRALGRLTQDIESLAESVAILDGSPAKLARAHSLFHLGIAFHRTARRADARTVLTEAHLLAHECGAAQLVDLAAEAIKRIAGRRPRAPRLGAEALTAQERRIAERAVGGNTNRQIAEELFLTLRTVEHHLTSVYRKLGISGRAELAASGLDPAATHQG
ncbi:AAA family ATPase [Solihabitans fulvus]|uniref:AAA family ATPase n=1 Tax=Solihabitans fulvus TaxID=1892852 RepID=A0A5B2XIB4_9PSEU|nr:LuxR family transcriptional regulator [Solihabitans fulvus]KAA2262671.1 AAA family ATPase [Solihabitans fulvus]